jgi:hypothetical protein
MVQYSIVYILLIDDQMNSTAPALHSGQCVSVRRQRSVRSRAHSAMCMPMRDISQHVAKVTCTPDAHAGRAHHTAIMKQAFMGAHAHPLLGYTALLGSRLPEIERHSR